MESKLARLRQILTERFSEDELRTLCFDLGVDYEVLPAEGKAGKARELVSYLERRKRLSELVKVGQRLRPDISWEGDARNLAAVRRRYLKAIATEERFRRWTGARYMEELSVQVLLDRPPSAAYGQADTVRYSDSQEELVHSVRELVEKNGKVLVLGELGMGKSTLLEKLMYVYADEARQTDEGAVLPVCVSLSRFSGDLWECIQAAVNEAGQLNLAREQVEALIRQNECLILFDDLSELGPYQEEGLRALESFAAIHNQHGFVFTCRTCEYRNELQMDTAIEIRQPSAKGILTRFTAELGERDGDELYRRIISDDQLSQLACSPFFVDMIVDLSKQGSLPRNRGQLLQEFVTRLLWREAAKHDIPARTKERALTRLGLEMQIEERRQYPEDRVRACFTSLIREWDEPVHWRELLKALRTDDLLREKSSRWFYRHAAFQHYFAAVGALNNPEPVRRNLGDEWWNPVVLFLVGIIPDPNDLIAEIAEVDPLLAYQALNACEREQVTADTQQALAHRVLAEIQPVFIDETPTEVLDALVGIGRYAVQPLLQACAEDETDALLDLTSEILSAMDESSVLEILTAALESSSAPVRRSAAYLLGEIGDDEVVPYLMEAVKDTSPETAAEAIRSLGKLGDKRAMKSLAEAARADDRSTWEGASLRRLAQVAIRQVETRQEYYRPEL